MSEKSYTLAEAAHLIGERETVLVPLLPDVGVDLAERPNHAMSQQEYDKLYELALRVRARNNDELVPDDPSRRS